jgi:uncharacterized protein YoxC
VVETYLSAAVAAVTLAGGAWRVLRGLHRFVAAVETNTRTVAALASELHAHTTQTTDALAGLDRRVTTLERTP